jgi:hypothetical protein
MAALFQVAPRVHIRREHGQRAAHDRQAQAQGATRYVTRAADAHMKSKLGKSQKSFLFLLLR